MSSSGASGLNLTTKGDIQGFAAAAARIPVGSNGQGLIAASGAALGVQYAGVWTIISDDTKGGASASFDFTAIAASYKHLAILISGRVASAAVDNVDMVFNNDTAGNYDWQRLNATAVVPASSTAVAAAAGRAITMPGTNAVANVPGGGVIFIPNYAGTTMFKLAIAVGGWEDAAAATSLEITYSTWLSAAAITRVTLLPNGAVNWVAASRATLYGIS